MPKHVTEAAATAAYGALVQHSATIPAALGWGASPALSPRLTNLRGGGVIGDVGATPKALFATYSAAQAAPTNRFYASPAGDDTAAGTYAAPWRTIKKCIEAANAAGAPARILVRTGTYLSGQGFEAVSPTVDTAFVAEGGPVTVSNGIASASYTFAAHATHTNTYYINPTPTGGVSRVLDLTRVDEFGNYRELVKVSSEAIANDTPGSYHEGLALYIHRHDGAAVTAANTRVLQTKSNFVLSSEVNVYVGTEDGSPWVIEGSANSVAGVDPGAVLTYVAAPTNAASKAFVMENVRADFAGEPTAGANSFTVDKWNGVAAYFNCQGNAPSKDGFNAHNGGNLATKMLVLTVNCSATDTGRSVQSCNGLTLHENVIGIDVAGRYLRGRGGTVHNIGASKHYLLGTHIDGDLGDINSGGGIHPNALRVADSAEVWAERVTINMPPGAFAYRAVSGTAKIHRRDCEPTRQPDAGPGVFDTF
ncbi:hydrolase [Arthrobacter phage Klevey]|uniref:Hydrolase n=1 Tax=Arthrobacter phage Klevey TaxID=2867481 RepID=A0AAE8XJX4_9CAUD|nr:hydrolase [Arthrobacter phage Klevey]